MQRGLVEVVDGAGVGPRRQQGAHVRVVQRRVVEGRPTLQVGSVYVTSGCNQQLHDGYLLVFRGDDEGRSSESILRGTLLFALVKSGTEIHKIKYIKQKCSGCVLINVFGFIQ